MRTIFLILFLVSHLCARVTIIPILLESYSVRSVALGKTFVSNSKDICSVFENSLGLCEIDTPQVSLLYNKSFADIGFGYFVFAYPFKKISIGIGILNMQTDTFETVIIFENPQTQETSIERSFIKGENNWIYSIALGLNLFKLDIGLNIKYYNSTLVEKYTAKGFSFCFGTRLNLSNFDFGFSLNNLGGKSSYYKEKFNLPLSMQCGLTYGTKNERFYHNFNVSIEYENQIYEGRNLLHMGVEWILPIGWAYQFNEVCFRIGYISNLLKNINSYFSAGLGIEWANFVIGYAFIPRSKLGISHFISVTYKFPVMFE